MKRSSADRRRVAGLASSAGPHDDDTLDVEAAPTERPTEPSAPGSENPRDTFNRAHEYNSLQLDC